MRSERWTYGAIFIMLFAAFAAREFSRQRYLFGTGGVLFALTFALMVAPAPAGSVRRISIYGCLCRCGALCLAHRVLVMLRDVACSEAEPDENRVAAMLAVDGLGNCGGASRLLAYTSMPITWRMSTSRR